MHICGDSQILTVLYTLGIRIWPDPLSSCEGRPHQTTNSHQWVLTEHLPVLTKNNYPSREEPVWFGTAVLINSIWMCVCVCWGGGGHGQLHFACDIKADHYIEFLDNTGRCTKECRNSGRVKLTTASNIVYRYYPKLRNTYGSNTCLVITVTPLGKVNFPNKLL